MEVFLDEGASLEHIRAQGRDHDRLAVTHVFADIKESAKFKSFTLSANGMLTRNECVLTLSGDECAAHVAGASVGDGKSFHHDDTVFITHDAVACESRQVFKKVLRNGATGVFQGKILVKEGAQKTDGYQISQSLLLDEDSQFLAKPELEIYADDVACSHGSTSGAIDEEALFYLCSRGISKNDAADMLTLAFLAEAVEEIENDKIADDYRRKNKCLVITAQKLMSVVINISKTYRKPIQTYSRLFELGASEKQNLAFLIGGCVISFVSQWPVQAAICICKSTVY